MRVALRRLGKAASTALGLALVLTAVVGAAYAGGGPPPAPGVPEIDPGSMGSALTLLIGGAFLLTGKARKG